MGPVIQAHQEGGHGESPQYRSTDIHTRTEKTAHIKDKRKHTPTERWTHTHVRSPRPSLHAMSTRPCLPSSLGRPPGPPALHSTPLAPLVDPHTSTPSFYSARHDTKGPSKKDWSFEFHISNLSRPRPAVGCSPPPVWPCSVSPPHPTHITTST